MEMMKTQSSISTSSEENTKLLFFENYKNEKNQYNVEEIFFGKAILLQQIRILKSDSNPHPKIKSMQSITQSGPIYNFEIFSRNLKKYSDKFECIFENSTVNENGGKDDCIFPLFSDFVTNHIVIRGNFERVTICVYGVPYTGTEGHLLLETAKNDVPLEKLQYTSDDLYYLDSNLGEKLNLTTDDIELLNNYTIESLISPYIKCEVMGGLKKAYYVNPPDVNMVEKTKTGYIYYENDLNYYSQCLYNFYLTLASSSLLNNTNEKNNTSEIKTILHTNLNNNSSKSLLLDEVTFQTYFKKISEIIKILISKNLTYLEDDCIFRTENNEIFHKIPEYLIDIIIFALEGKAYGYSEVKHSLKLLKIMTNSSFMVSRFIDKCGMEVLYNLILAKEKGETNEKESSVGVSPTGGFMVIKVLLLENIYRLLTHAKAFNKFMETIDRSKLQQQYFMIREYTKDFGGDYNETMDNNFSKIDKEKENNLKSYSSKDSKKKSKTSDRDKNRDKDKDRDKEREKKKSKKEKKSKKDKKNKSGSDRSKSRSRSRTISKDHSRASSEFSARKTKEKKQAKNVLLKNGYQIILTLIIGKRNNLIINMVKKIINKVSCLMYLREFSNYINTVNIADGNEDNNNIVYNKMTIFLQKIFEYLQKIEIAYKKSYDKDQPCGFSDDYPYRTFNIDYLKIGRRFFKKSENYNLKSTLENENNSSNKITDNKIITNEIAIMLEENNFIENLIVLMVIYFINFF